MPSAATASVFDSILTSIKTTVTTIGLRYNSVLLPVNKRKFPNMDEELDAIPAIFVCPHPTTPERIKLASFEGDIFVEYSIVIAIIAPGNQDFVALLDAELAWREKVRNKFLRPPLAGVPKVWKLRVNMEEVLDPRYINTNYDYGAMAVQATSQEYREVS